MVNIQFIAQLTDKVSAPFTKIVKVANKVQSSVADVSASADKMNKRFKKAIFPKGIGKGLGTMDRQLKRINRILVGGIIGRTIAGWGTQVLDTVVSFEKFETQLTRVFDSENKAKSYLGEITEFATKSKLPIDQVSQAFVNLAKEGATLNPKQMQAIGDFAVFSAVDVSKLTDAVSAVSDPAKWKELGISVSTLGGKMRASFNGMTVNVANTKDGALEMLTAFGQLNDVQGASSQKSQEVGRNLTGLKNNFEALKLDIGEKLKPAILGFIEAMSNMVTRLRAAVDWVQKNQEQVKFWGTALLKITGVVLGFIAAAKLIAIVTAVINGVTFAFGVLKTVLAAARTAMMLFNFVVLANPIGLLIAGVAALVATFWGLYRMFPQIGQGISDFYNWVVDWFGRAYEFVQANFIDPIVAMFPNLGEQVGAFYGWIVEWVGKAAGFVKDIFIAPLLAVFPDAIKGIFNFYKGVVVWIGKAFVFVKKTFIDPLLGVFEKAANFLGFGGQEEQAEESPQGGAQPLKKITKENFVIRGSDVQPQTNTNAQTLPTAESRLQQIQNSSSKNVNNSFGAMVQNLVVHTTAEDRPQDIKEQIKNALLEVSNDTNYAT